MRRPEVSGSTGSRPVDGTVVIFRCGLLSASETFVRNHGDALTQWQPIFLGATKIKSYVASDSDVIAFSGELLERQAFLLLRMTGRSPRLVRILAELRPDLVHAHFGGDGWLISRPTVRASTPLIITLHGYDVTQQPSAPGIRGLRHRRNLRKAFERSSLILAVSDFIRRRAIELGADPGKVQVHYTGVPIPDVPRSQIKRWDAVFVGRFVEKKGLDDLVEALGMVQGLRPRTLFIGAGPMEDTIRQRAAELKLDATFLGAQHPSVVHECMAASRMLVAPSKTARNGDAEGLPTTVLEAASLGVPVISTLHSGIPEAVVNGETGLLCAEGDRAGLAKNIQCLLTNDPLCTRLGQQARGHVEARFDLAKQTRRLEELYAQVVGRRTRTLE